MNAAAPDIRGQLVVWQSSHRNCGRCGPFPDAKVHVWAVWRCPCGSKFYVPEEQVNLGERAVGESRP